MSDSKQEKSPHLKPNSDLFELDERTEKKLTKALSNFDLGAIKEIISLHDISTYEKDGYNILLCLPYNLTRKLYNTIIKETFAQSQACEELRNEVSAIPNDLLAKLIPSFAHGDCEFINLVASGLMEDELNQKLIAHEQEVSFEIRQTLFQFLQFCRNQYEINIALVLQIIEAAVKQGVPINKFSSDIDGPENPLSIAFDEGYIDMTLFKCLLSNNADVLANNPVSGRTILEISIHYPRAFDMFNLFIEMGKLEIDKMSEEVYNSVKAALIKKFQEHNGDTFKIYEELVTRRYSRKPSSLFWQCAKKLANFDHKQVATSLEYKQVNRLNQEPTLGSITPTTLGVIVDPVMQDKLTVYWVDGNGKLNHEVSVAPEIAAAIPKEADEPSNDTALIEDICVKFGCSKKIPEEMVRVMEEARPLNGYS